MLVVDRVAERHDRHGRVDDRVGVALLDQAPHDRTPSLRQLAADLNTVCDHVKSSGGAETDDRNPLPL